MTAADEGLLSQPDPVIAKAAKEEGRILLTLDIEFADLRKYPPGSHPGIILFRPQSLGPGTVNQFIEAHQLPRNPDHYDVTKSDKKSECGIWHYEI